MYSPGPATLREKHRRLTCRVSRSDYRHILIVVKNGLHTGACMMNSGRLEPFCAFNVELSPAHAGCSQDCTGAEFCTAIEMERMKIVRTGCGIDAVDNDRSNHLRTELEHLQNPPRGEVVSGETVRKTDEVLDSGRCCRLPTRTEPIQHDGRNALRSRVNGRCNSSRSRAHDREVDSIRRA